MRNSRFIDFVQLWAVVERAAIKELVRFTPFQSNYFDGGVRLNTYSTELIHPVSHSEPKDVSSRVSDMTISKLNS